MTTFLWWEMCSGRKEQVCNVPGGKLLMSTVFHNLFPDSFQGKCIIQNDLSGCIDYSHPKHAWHLKQVVRLSSQAWGGRGGVLLHLGHSSRVLGWIRSSVLGCLFCSINHPWTEMTGLRGYCGRTWKSQSFQQSLTLMLKGKTWTLKYGCVCAADLLPVCETSYDIWD